MEKKFNRVLSLVLALVMVVGLIPVGHIHTHAHAAEARATTNYRWDYTGKNVFTPYTAEGYTANPVTVITSSATATNFRSGVAKLAQPVILLHDEEWSIELSANDKWYDALLSSHENVKTKGAQYIIRSSSGETGIGIYGKHASGSYNQWLVDSNRQDDTLVYSFRNVVERDEDGNYLSNTPCLYVGDTKVGDLTSFYVDWARGDEQYDNGLNGQDLVFNYIGCTEKSIEINSFGYLEIKNAHIHTYDNACDANCNGCGTAREVGDHVYDNVCDANCNECGTAREVGGHVYDDACDADCNECGTVREDAGHAFSAWVVGKEGLSRECSACGHDEFASYTANRWEVNDDVLQSVATGGYFVENTLTKNNGTITEGVLSKYYATMADTVALDHNKPWTIEWKASGNWYGMLLTSDANKTADMDIIFRVNDSGKNYHGVTMGTVASTKYHFYGVSKGQVAEKVEDVTQKSVVWKLVNEVKADGSNMVVAYVDGEKIGDMTTYFFQTSATDGTTKSWLDGRDIEYKFFGSNTTHKINALKLEYLEIWPNGKPAGLEEDEHVCEFTIEGESFPGENCDEEGYTVWACECGETEQRPNGIFGHIWADADCDTPKTCEECGETEGESLGHTPEEDDGDCTTAVACSVCGKEAVAGKAHTPGEDDDDCTTAVACTVCGKEAIAGKAHTPEEDDGDCTTAIKCSVCGTETTAAAQHDFSEEEKVTPGADCKTNGVTVWGCSKCDETEERENDVKGEHIGHKVTESTTGADCKTAGVDTYTCECGDSYTEANEKFGDHVFGEWNYNDEGTAIIRTCTVCTTETETAKFAVEYHDKELDTYRFAGFQNFEEALEMANENAGRLIMFEDVEIDELTLEENATLDLNGHVLTAGYVYALDAYVVDFNYGSGTGKLKIEKSNAIFGGFNYGMIPIWNGVDGYIFSYEQYYQEMTDDTSTPNTVKFYFLPEFWYKHHEFLAAGKGVSGVELKIKMSWTKDGVADSRTLNFSDELVKRFIESYNEDTGKYDLAFKLTVTGVDIVDEGSLKFEVFIEANGAVIQMCEPA